MSDGCDYDRCPRPACRATTPKETPVSETYPAGTVAVATVRFVNDVRVVYDAKHDGWVTTEVIAGGRWHHAAYVTDIRPLVVLDPENTAQMRELVQRAQITTPGTIITPIVEKVRNALRSLAARPRPAEPLGLGAVVEATAYDEAREFVRLAFKDTPWVDANGTGHEWDELHDVEVKSDGWTRP